MSFNIPGVLRVTILAVFLTSGAERLSAQARTRQPVPGEPKAVEQAEKSPQSADAVPIDLKLPKPAFKGTPKHVPPGTRLEKPLGKPRPPFLAPPGSTNVAKGKRVSSSDEEPIIGALKLVTDGDKEPTEGAFVELGPGRQHVQIDLGADYKIYAVVFWHYHINARVYHDVVVQVSPDKDFITGVKTLFNNDHDNSSGQGVGDGMEYWETYEGKLVDAGGVEARYVRLYSKGSTADDQNHYTEVEVYGLAAK